MLGHFGDPPRAAHVDCTDEYCLLWTLNASLHDHIQCQPSGFDG